MANENDVPVIQTKGSGAPRALIFAGAAGRPLTPAEAKRVRFIHNLKANYRRLKEALEFIERFGSSCGISKERIEAIRRASDQALDELSRKFDERIKIYDDRIKGETS